MDEHLLEIKYITKLICHHLHRPEQENFIVHIVHYLHPMNVS